MNQLQKIVVIPTGKPIGAEVKGIDFSLPISDGIISLLNKAWRQHLVLFFRNQNLTQKEYLNVAKVFGEIQVSASKAVYVKNKIESTLVPKELSVLTEISAIHNLDKNGSPTVSNKTLGSEEVYWHTDNAYVEKPVSGGMLFAKAIPPTGGDTSFSNQYLAYERLPQDVFEVIDGKKLTHDSSLISMGAPVPHHPIIRTHPVTKRKALYLGIRRQYPAQRIIGLSEQESTKIMDFLWNHATNPELVWRHKWNVGDIVLYDNVCTLHHREAYSASHKRILYRLLFKGDKPY